MVTPCKRPIHKRLAIISLLALFLALPTTKASAQNGEAIYKANCRSCHFLNDKMSTGPGLAGVSGRHSKEWAFKWVLNNIEFAKTDAEAAATTKLTSNTMSAFAGVLKDDEIKAVIDYIWSEPGEKVVTTDGTPPPTDGGTPVAEGLNPFYLTLIIIAVLLILISALRSVRRNLQNAVNERKGEAPMIVYRNWRHWASANKRSFALILIVIFAYGSKAGWDGMMGIGVYEGYKPSQPIKFSHKIHAGTNKIACEYCHSGVLKSKVAGVPSVNVCMNCHKGIDHGPQTGEKEIAKIYAAAGFDPATKTYTKEPHPLQWNKVHVLPDFVFFSHQQHVVAGKQECKNCHGDVDKMDVAHQDKPLTMGWCIECHNKTEVPGMKTNPYYEELHKKLAEKYRNASDSTITVARMGGIECSKCHY